MIHIHISQIKVTNKANNYFFTSHRTVILQMYTIHMNILHPPVCQIHGIIQLRRVLYPSIQILSITRIITTTVHLFQMSIIRHHMLYKVHRTISTPWMLTEVILMCPVHHLYRTASRMVRRTN